MNGLLRGFRDLSLRKKLILSYCAVIIIPLCLLGAYAYGSANQDLKRQLRVSSAATADQLASELAYRFERQEYPIKSIVFNPKVVSAVADTDKDVYELAVELNEDVEPIFWNYLFFMSEMKEIAIYSERRNTPFGNFFQPASLVRGEAWYAETGTSTATRWWSDGSTLFATRNIYEPGNGERQGMLYIRFDFEHMVGEVANKINGADGVVLKDRDGGIVYSSLKEGTAASQANFLRMDRAIPQTGWTLSYYAGTAHIAEGTASIIQATGAMILLCMAVLSVIIALFSRTLLHGLNKLNDRMKRVEEGELDLVVSAASRDEIGQLTNRFGHMLRRINLLIEESYVNRIARKEAELTALQAQINPHFLFNTLNSLKWSAMLGGNDAVSQGIASLSELLRNTILVKEELIPLNRELDNLTHYATIQRIRYGDSFELEFAMEDELRDCLVPKFILQPIVENSILHGGGDEGRSVRIKVTGERDGARVRIRIRDDGKGFDAAEAGLRGTTHAKLSGIGIGNVDERIRLHFGVPYGLTTASVVQEGTETTIVLPIVLKGERDDVQDSDRG